MPGNLLLQLIFSCVLCDSTPRFVGLSVYPSVGTSHFTFLALMEFLAMLRLTKCSTDLKYSPCPPARDWGSRVSGLVKLLFSFSFFPSVFLFSFFYATLWATFWLVGPSVRWSVRHTLLVFGFCSFWPHCSCPNNLVTSIMAPAHPHATSVAVYPALFYFLITLVVNWVGDW